MKTRMLAVALLVTVLTVGLSTRASAHPWGWGRGHWCGPRVGVSIGVPVPPVVVGGGYYGGCAPAPYYGDAYCAPAPAPYYGGGYYAYPRYGGYYGHRAYAYGGGWGHREGGYRGGYEHGYGHGGYGRGGYGGGYGHRR